MKGATGTGLVIVGFVLLYLAITDKLDCLFTMFDCMFGTKTVQATGNKVDFTQSKGVNAPTPFAMRDFRV